MSALADKLVDFKLEIYDALNYTFNRINPSRMLEIVHVEPSDCLVDGSTQRTRHNFARDKMSWHNPNYIYYGGYTIARTQSKPHKAILVLKGNPSTRMARNILIKTLHDNFPEVKVVHDK